MTNAQNPMRSPFLVLCSGIRASSPRMIGSSVMGTLLPSILLVGLVFSMADALSAAEKTPVAKAEQVGDQIQVSFDGKPFTNYHLKGYPKPILYPVLGPNGVEMTRHYPMKKGVAGEAKDHPHHQSIWFAHGNVNGVDFWTIRDHAGKILHEKLVECSAEGNEVTLVTDNRWVDSKGRTVCTDTTRLGLRAEGDTRLIDYSITIHAGEKDLVFGDTKEGTMALRTHPALRLQGNVAKGHGRNSKGDVDKKMWGQRAAWVDYWGPVDGETVGIAMLDHPSNPRHPTWWHARAYGLVAANAFGVHDFEKKPAGTGDMTIPAGESKTFRYLLIFHRGDWKEAKIAEQFEKFSADTPDKK